MDLGNMMAAAIEAALKPTKERLEDKVIPIRRTLGSIQAECVALRSQEKRDDFMASCGATDATRLRLGSNV